jgi:hypothetical protein
MVSEDACKTFLDKYQSDPATSLQGGYRSHSKSFKQ